MRQQHGEGELSAVIVLFVIGYLIWLGASSLFGGEREGTVKFEDCREVVRLAPDTMQRYYKTFTCTTQKTAKGLTMHGVCVHIVSDSSLFSSSHTCATAFVYEKKQDPVCTNSQFPYLGYDDQCYAYPQ